MRTRITLIAAVVLTLLAVAAPAQATYPGHNGPILFDQVGDRQLFTVQPDGGTAHKLTHEHGVNHREASYSADGHRIVYDRGRARFASLATLHADGTHNRVVADRVTSDPIFSASGNSILFDNQVQIFSVGSNGSALHALTPGFPEMNEAPTASPDGSQIVFNCVVNGMYRGLCSMSPDGSNAHPVFDSGTETPLNPNFAPNGRKVLVVLLGPGAGDAIASVGLANGTVHVIRSFGSSGRVPIGRPAYSPNGKRIALTLAPSAGSDDSDVWTMRADGSHLRRLTHTPGAHSGRLDDWRPLP